MIFIYPIRLKKVFIPVFQESKQTAFKKDGEKKNQKSCD